MHHEQRYITDFLADPAEFNEAMAQAEAYRNRLGNSEDEWADPPDAKSATDPDDAEPFQPVAPTRPAQRLRKKGKSVRSQVDRYCAHRGL